MYLKPGGYLIFTCFDGQEINKLLTGKDKHTTYYTNDKGEKKIMFEILKKYDDSEIKNGVIGLGTAIDFHNAIDFQEDVYMTEYLVDKEFISKELYERCDMELIETDLFANQFHIHADFFRQIYKYEENPQTKKFFTNVAEFYNQSTSVNKAGFEMTKLNRYFVFRRKETASSSKSKQKGGNIDETETVDYETADYEDSENITFTETNSDIKNSKIVEKFDSYEHLFGKNDFFIKPNITYINHSFQEGIYNVLQDNGYIPNNISMNGFFDDIGMDVTDDNDINEKSITRIAKGISIDHEEEGKTSTVLNGLNFLVLEKDCDGDLLVSGYGKKKKVSKKDKTIVF